MISVRSERKGEATRNIWSASVAIIPEIQELG
jgi:hypothetical protein